MTTPEYDAHKDHNVSYLPFVAEDGSDARQGELVSTYAVVPVTATAAATSRAVPPGSGTR
jgi:hypothetical protein